MPDKKIENEKTQREPKIGALRLRRETLRELSAGELKQAQGGPGSTHQGFTCRQCTRRCATAKKC
jgi:hypothetical protein